METIEEIVKIHAEDLKIVQKVAILLCILSFIGGVFVGIGINIINK